MSAIDLLTPGKIDGDVVSAIIQEYGTRGKNAVELVLAGKVKKYRDFFVVQGRKDQYVVEGDFCTCRDYLYRLAKQDGVCYHSLAVKIASATGQYEEVDAWYSDTILQREYGQ
ncbi:SWIM zinc finger family protein [Methanocella sp. MCL-LM]|uniref:SWIM zinc finger family protein n=1 Tax=Methanocella sp. MCL-LM TaxID=3412035 RepID=UPI003C7638A0